MTKNFARSVLTLLAVFGAARAIATDTTSLKSTIKADYSRPLSFEPNRGQTDNRVDFFSHGAGYSLFLSHAEALMVLNGGAAVRMRPIGSNGLAPVEALDQQSGKSNYFIGNVPEQWRTNIPNFAKVRYQNVYPGVDLIYYGNQRQLEYDFVVAPGANARTIALQFDGPSKPDLDRKGDLVMRTSAGELRWHKPVAYQVINGERQMVACNYARKGQRVAFRLGTYDITKPLVIDPVLVYATYLGGSGAAFQESHEGGGDVGSGIAVDASGNAYVVGTTISTNFPIKNAFQSKFPSSCCTSVFVTKFGPTGSLLYSTYLGGSGFVGVDATFEGDSGTGIAVDAHGNAYVTGSSGSLNFPLKNAFQTHNYNAATSSCLPCFTAFVTKLDAAGNALVFSTYLGGHGFLAGDAGRAIAVDADENAYVTGSTDSTDFPTKNAFQATVEGSTGSVNAFVTKFDPAGNALVYSTYFGGSNGTHGVTVLGNGIAVDAERNAYITGSTNSPNLPTKNAFQKTLKGPQNAFVAKFDATGNELAYSSYLGGGGKDQGNSIAVDSAGDAYITGVTSSTNFPIKNAFQKTLKSLVNGNAFVTKLTPSGSSLVYSTYLGGSGENFPGDAGTGIAVDAHGNAFVTGVTSSNDFPRKNAVQNAFGGGFSDAFVTEIDAADCALVYSTYLGGSSADLAAAIAIDANGNAYITGYTTSINFPAKNAFQTKLKSANGNAFVSKISAK